LQPYLILDGLESIATGQKINIVDDIVYFINFTQTVEQLVMILKKLKNGNA